jgi:N-acetylglucosaminyldiphosphoundecaprenol N-acetyl-beta-D-mannosaminyltransferase
MSGAERIYGPDLMLSICAGCEAHDQSVFLFGGTQAEIDALQVFLRRRFPALRIAGAVAPGLLPDKPAFDPHTVALINGSGARVVFVGLGCPKQEYWLRSNAGEIAGMSLGVGQAFAQLAGLKRRAPAWMAERGLEWLFRLAQEPRRLWRRYLVGNSLFVWYLFREAAWRSSTPTTPT